MAQDRPGYGPHWFWVYLMSDYLDFLATKAMTARSVGFKAQPADFLYDFQAFMVEWALKRGRAAVFADCGLGKTFIQLDWAQKVAAKTKKPVLILAPLAVSHQTKKEGAKFDIRVTVCRGMSDVKKGINITNYEMLAHFDDSVFGGIVLDESSILKNYGGKTRQQITDFAKSIPYRLACTATPAPNDLVEICNHAEFLDVMSGKEIIALFFRQDGNTTRNWRLKNHARADFWRWFASWAIACRHPRDLGFEGDDDQFTLPPLKVIQHTVEVAAKSGFFAMEARTLQDRLNARRESIDQRVAACAKVVNASDEPWLVWCNLNDESDALCSAIPGAVEVRGSDSVERKTDVLLGFAEGRYTKLVTKPTIAGFGMNWQHCAREAFVGLSDSFEQYYQAVRRCWRFGQTRTVEAHVFVAKTEGAVVANIKRKEKDCDRMMAALIKNLNAEYTKYRDDDRYDGKLEIKKPSWLKGV